MGRVILSVLSLVALAVIIVMNVGAQSDFNLLGWQLESVPVTAIAISGFVLGVFYSFVFYLANYLAKGRRERLAAKRQKLKNQEQQIKSRDADLKQREKVVTAIAEQSQEPAAGQPEPRRGFAGLFGRRKPQTGASGPNASPDASS